MAYESILSGGAEKRKPRKGSSEEFGLGLLTSKREYLKKQADEVDSFSKWVAGADFITKGASTILENNQEQFELDNLGLKGSINGIIADAELRLNQEKEVQTNFGGNRLAWLENHYRTMLIQDITRKTGKVPPAGAVNKRARDMAKASENDFNMSYDAALAVPTGDASTEVWEKFVDSQTPKNLAVAAFRGARDFFKGGKDTLEEESSKSQEDFLNDPIFDGHRNFKKHYKAMTIMNPKWAEDIQTLVSLTKREGKAVKDPNIPAEFKTNTVGEYRQDENGNVRYMERNVSQVSYMDIHGKLQVQTSRGDWSTSDERTTQENRIKEGALSNILKLTNNDGDAKLMAYLGTISNKDEFNVVAAAHQWLQSNPQYRERFDPDAKDKLEVENLIRDNYLVVMAGRQDAAGNKYVYWDSATGGYVINPRADTKGYDNGLGGDPFMTQDEWMQVEMKKYFSEGDDVEGFSGDHFANPTNMPSVVKPTNEDIQTLDDADINNYYGLTSTITGSLAEILNRVEQDAEMADQRYVPITRAFFDKEQFDEMTVDGKTFDIEKLLEVTGTVLSDEAKSVFFKNATSAELMWDKHEQKLLFKVSGEPEPGSSNNSQTFTADEGNNKPKNKDQQRNDQEVVTASNINNTVEEVIENNEEEFIPEYEGQVIHNGQKGRWMEGTRGGEDWFKPDNLMVNEVEPDDPEIAADIPWIKRELDKIEGYNSERTKKAAKSTLIKKIKRKRKEAERKGRDSDVVAYDIYLAELENTEETSLLAQTQN